MELPKRNILCIDLKSFFASCECIDKGLDPFTTPLVVANKKQGNGAITLAVTPYLKSMGVKSRGRLYEIPHNIKYIIANPRMRLYIEMSKKVVEIYLNYISEDDLHIYSIDECFLDVTDYLKLYNKTDYELGLTILDDIKNKLGLTATCGIGPNMLLAKLSMDIEAKKNSSFIAKWSYEDVKEKLWPLTPLSKMWGIGKNMERNLNKLKIYSVGDLANYNKNILKDKFGVMGEELWNHANGIDLSKISDWKKIKKSYSFSHSQVLFKDYYDYNISIIIRELIEVLTIRLRKYNKEAIVIGLGIGYSKTYTGGFYHNMKIDSPTDNEQTIYDICKLLFDKYYIPHAPIRKVSISLGGLKDKKGIQLNLFNSYEHMKETDNLNRAVDSIKNKYGKNILLKGSSLLNDSTIKERNEKIGGHHE